MITSASISQLVSLLTTVCAITSFLADFFYAVVTMIISQTSKSLASAGAAALKPFGAVQRSTVQS
jgi:hypothetical protein